MRVAVVSDEISEDLTEVVQLGSLLGVTAYELRWVCLPGAVRRMRVSELTVEQAAALAEVVRRQGAAISAISPGTLFGRYGEDLAFDSLMACLEHCFRLAEALGTRDIIVRGFQPPESRRNGVCPRGVLGALGDAAGRAQAAGFRLLLRNSSDSYADTGAHTASIVHAVHSEALGVSWDPCHAARAGEDAVGDGYGWVAPFVRDVRVRDQTQCQALGFEYTVLAQGCMDWPAQLRALARDGYQGTVTVGAQLEPRLLNTMHSLEALRKLLTGLEARP